MEVMYDSLTGAYARDAILELLEQKCLQRERFTLLFLDLNKFKQVNDTYGHKAGDTVLAQSVKRVKRSIRKEDVVGRYGGDEFLVFLNHTQHKESVKKVAQKILKSVAEPYRCDKRSISFISVSIGVAFCEKSGDSRMVVENADKAMYFAKKFLKSHLAFYDELHVKEERNFRSEFLEGFSNDEVFCKLQPIYHNGERVAYEIFPIWINIYFGDVAYPQFQEIVAQFEYEEKFDIYIFTKAFALFERVKLKGNLHINISTKFFQSVDFLDFVEELFKRHPRLKNRVVLEFEESAMVSKSIDINALLERLKGEYGVGFCVDNINSGLLSLVNYPIDYMKFGISFGKNLQNEKRRYILQAINFFAKTVDAILIADEVESEVEKELLEEVGIDYFQGEYLSKPHFPNYFNKKIV